MLCSCLPPAPRCGLSVLFPSCLSDVVSHLSPRRRRRLVFLRTFQKTTKVFLRRAGFHAKAAMSVTLTHARGPAILQSVTSVYPTKTLFCGCAIPHIQISSLMQQFECDLLQRFFTLLCSSLLNSLRLYSTLLASTQLFSAALLNSSRLLYSTLLGCSTRLYILKSSQIYPALLDITRLYSTLLLYSALLCSVLLYSTPLYCALLYSTLL